MAKISIIIPCYNVEQYIDRCLYTITNQTIGINNLEIILVNDASTDSTLEKLYSWEKMYPDNIMVVTYDKNIRQGGARNVGMQYATSEYIGFVDSDDWIELDMYEKLYLVAQENNCDVVKCKFERNTEWVETKAQESDSEIIKYTFEKKGDWYDHNIDYVGVNGEFGGIWCGLYRREVIVENNLLFPEGIAYEDNYWVIVLSMYIKDMYIIDRVMYHYFNNEKSTIHDISRINDRLKIELAIVDEYKRVGAFDLFYDKIQDGFLGRYFLNTIFIISTRFIGCDVPFSFDEMRNNIVTLFPNYKNSQKYRNSTAMDKILFLLLDIPIDVHVDLEAVRQVYYAYMLAGMGLVK